MTVISLSLSPRLPFTSFNSKHSGLSHSSAARALGSSGDPYEEPEIDSGSSDEETNSVMGDSIVKEVRLVVYIYIYIL